MSNRRKKAEPTDIRTPLLHCLDVEYQRATKAKNIARMEAIAAIVEAVNRLGEEPVAAEPAESVPVEADQGPLPVFLRSMAFPMPLPQSIVQTIEQAIPALSPDERKSQARAAVTNAVNDANRQLADGQLLYAEALMAKNGNLAAMERFTTAAGLQGVTVEELVSTIVAEHDAKQRRTLYIYTRQTQALRQIDETDDAAELTRIATEAVRDILGESA